VVKRSGENIMRIADEAKQVVKQMQPLLPQTLTIDVTSDMSNDVRLMVSDLEDIENLLGILPLIRISVLRKLFPGRVTVLLENTLRKPIPVFKYFDEHGRTLARIGFRIPDHPLCAALTRGLDNPISTTSANISGRKPGASVKDIIADFGDKIDLILDAGELGSSKASTVIDFTRSPHLIIREGDVSLNKLHRLLPDVPFKKRRTHFVVTFVCSGNICRSPMAEAILKKKLSKTKYKNIVTVQSAGTLELARSRAHYLAMLVAEENEIDLDKHLSKYINRKIVRDSDLIFCMALNHYDFLKEHFPQEKHKFVLLKQWKNETRLFIPSIADPIGHDQEFFVNTFNEIHGEINRVMPFLFQEIRKFMEYNDIDVR
jgi:protein-tyrosine phosphatase